MSMWKRVAMVMSVAVAGALSLGVGGCGPSKPRMGVYNLTVSADPSLNDSASGRLAQVEVDVVGVSTTDLPNWQGYSVDSYFSGADAFRAGAREYARTLNFSASDSGPKTIAKNDPIWQEWRKRGAMHLVVMASSRMMRPSGGVDRRRLVLPLDAARWKVEGIEIQVKSGGVESPTKMEEVKQ